MSKNYKVYRHPERSEGSGIRFFGRCPQNDAMMRGEQHGRSMVEMLGVLAVIGVLSVAGIAGYTTAMRSYRTNEIVNAASMLYIMAQAQNAGNGPTGNVTYASINNGTNPSGVSTLEYNNNVISITFNDEKDCAMAKNKLGDKAGDCTAATSPATGYTLTVTLGETTPGPDYYLTTDDDGKDCSGSGLVCPSDDSYYFLMCEDGKWVRDDEGCCYGCKDHKMHKIREDACIDSCVAN